MLSSLFAVFVAFCAIIFSLHRVLFSLCAVANSIYAVPFFGIFTRPRSEEDP